MKSTPTASPSSTTQATARPAAASSPASRPASVVDYRTNVERQAREQKSVGGVLSILVYVLIGFFIVGAGLAGYGMYIITRQIHQQSVTVNELDQRYAAANAALVQQQKSTMDTLAQAQAQIGRQQELILRQQEAINKLLNANEQLSSSLQTERQTRAGETASLRARVHSLEDHGGPTTQRY